MPTNTKTAPISHMERRKRDLKARLRELARPSKDREDLRIEYLADPIDQVSASSDRDFALRRIDHQTHLIHDIQFALTKIDEGDYGICESCEEPIAQKRLKAVPWARLCVACQSKSEAQKRPASVAFENAA